MIINSLLDTDFYKLMMSAFLSTKPIGKDRVLYKFKNRTDIRPPTIISMDELKKELSHLFSLGFSYSELRYLEGLGRDSQFTKQWLDSISQCVPSSSVKYSVSASITDIELTIEGPWWIATLYETPCLAIINELYGNAIEKNLIKDEQTRIAHQKLIEKVDFLKAHESIQFIEFGTRRRRSFHWQEYVISELSTIDHNPMFGTSNPYFAMKHNLKPLGTMAHEIPMGYAAHSAKQQGTSARDILILSQAVAMNEWIAFNPNTFWLTDTYGSKFFLDNIYRDTATIGLRQDSGDPCSWLKMVYDKIGNNIPVMFSDGLNTSTIYRIYRFASELGFRHDKVFFGWGTNLTNDGVIRPLSMVIKLDRMIVNNQWVETCKLSDNINKAKGSQNTIDYYKDVFEYYENVTTEEECIY